MAETMAFYPVHIFGGSGFDASLTEFRENYMFVQTYICIIYILYACIHIYMYKY